MASTGTAIVLAGAGVFHHFVFFLPGLEHDRLRQEAAHRQAAAPPPELRQHCRETGQLLHDVHWAAACMLLARETEVDDPNECTLPSKQAAAVYAAMQEAEDSCLAESR